MPWFTYRAFGLLIETDTPIAGLSPAPALPPDLRIHMGSVPATVDLRDAALRELWQSEVDAEDPGDAVTLYAAGDDVLVLHYADRTRFVFARDGRDIWATWPDDSSLDIAGTYLLGPVLGFVLRLRGITCLHASVVVVAGRAVALTGPAGMGKSTTAGAFALRGGGVIADDIAVLQQRGTRWDVHPTIPGVRLWDDSAEMLLGSADALPLLAVGWEKRCLDLQQLPAGFRPDEPVPLGAVYVLSPPGADAPADPRRLGGREALMALVSNTYANVLLDAPMRRAEFTALGLIANTVPVWHVTAAADADDLDRFCAALAATGPAAEFRPGGA